LQVQSCRLDLRLGKLKAPSPRRAFIEAALLANTEDCIPWPFYKHPQGLPRAGRQARHASGVLCCLWATSLAQAAGGARLCSARLYQFAALDDELADLSASRQGNFPHSRNCRARARSGPSPPSTATPHGPKREQDSAHIAQLPVSANGAELNHA
jgi:hypothetical protein